MRITFVIDELRLVGFDPRSRHRIADALERELAAAWLGNPAGPLRVSDARVARASAAITVQPGVPPAPTSVARGIAGGIVRALAAAGDAS